MAALIDRRLLLGAMFFVTAGTCTLFGKIHSPLANGGLIVAWSPPAVPVATAGQTPHYIAAGYFAAAVLLAVWGFFASDKVQQAQGPTWRRLPAAEALGRRFEPRTPR